MKISFQISVSFLRRCNHKGDVWSCGVILCHNWLISMCLAQVLSLLWGVALQD